VIVVFTEGERETPPQCNSLGMDVSSPFHFQLEAKIHMAFATFMI
jgi:hypothetical protein